MDGDDRDRADEKAGGWWPGEEPPKEPKAPKEPKDPKDPKGPDRPRVPRGLSSPDKPRTSSRYSLFVGLAFVALIVVALLNLLNDDNSGILGIRDSDGGLPLAEFAVPNALAGLDNDANVAQDDCESSRNPCPEDERRTPACEISTAGAIRVCDLFDKPLAISFWFTRGGDCLSTQDNFDAVAARYEGEVNFLNINIRDEVSTVADIVRSHNWSVPVGLDRDGAVSNLYRVGGCPTIVLAYPGGILDKAEIGNRSTSEIAEMIDGLIAASRRRAEAVR